MKSSAAVTSPVFLIAKLFSKTWTSQRNILDESATLSMRGMQELKSSTATWIQLVVLVSKLVSMFLPLQYVFYISRAVKYTKKFDS
jgi:hypothetical protein